MRRTRTDGPRTPEVLRASTTENAGLAGAQAAAVSSVAVKWRTVVVGKGLVMPVLT